MASKSDLQQWVLDALRDHDGSAKPLEVAKHIWRHHEQDLRNSDDLFYTWQYDMRWAAQRLRDNNQLRRKHGQRTGPWELA